MTPLEVLVACTANAAAAVSEADRIGAIHVGHAADLVVLDVPNLETWFYEVGRPRVRLVIKNGHPVHRSSPRELQ
jgi:imidazolonepropionase